MYRIAYSTFTIILCFLVYISVNDINIYTQTFCILQIILLQIGLQNTFYNEYKSGFLEQIFLLPKPQTQFISILLRNYFYYGTPISIILFFSLLLLNKNISNNMVYIYLIKIFPIIVSNIAFISIFMLCNAILCSQEIKKSISYIAIIPICIPIFFLQNTLDFFHIENMIIFIFICISTTIINTIATYFAIKSSIQ